MRQSSIFDSATPNNALMDFVHREAENMWDTAEHRKRSIAQVLSFAGFSDMISHLFRLVSKVWSSDVRTLSLKFIGMTHLFFATNRNL